MKVNPVAIQSYQQLTRRQQDANAVRQEQAAATENDVTINPQATTDRSELAVKAPSGSYAEYLNEAEKTALDLLFKRFADDGRFGEGYSGDTGTDSEARTVGRLLDVKV
jgi:hypothetical protein